MSKERAGVGGGRVNKESEREGGEKGIEGKREGGKERKREIE